MQVYGARCSIQTGSSREDGSLQDGPGKAVIRSQVTRERGRSYPRLAGLPRGLEWR